MNSQEKRIALMQYLNKLRIDKGITQEELANITGFERSNINRMMFAKYSPTLDNFITIADALGYQVSILEKSAKPETPRTGSEPQFMLCPDHTNGELYILHRHFPACLIWVKQETPVRFIIQDLYDDVHDVNDLLTMQFVQKAKDFYTKFAESTLDQN